MKIIRDMKILITYTKDGRDIKDYYPFIKVNSFDNETIEGEIKEEDIPLLKPFVCTSIECCSIYDKDGELIGTETTLFNTPKII